MYKAEPNDTKHRPQELPYLVRNSETNLITRYCRDLSDAESHANRLNKVYYPEALVETTALAEVAVAAPQEGEEQFSLF